MPGATGPTTPLLLCAEWIDLVRNEPQKRISALFSVPKGKNDLQPFCTIIYVYDNIDEFMSFISLSIWALQLNLSECED